MSILLKFAIAYAFTVFSVATILTFISEFSDISPEQRNMLQRVGELLRIAIAVMGVMYIILFAIVICNTLWTIIPA